MNGLSKFLIYSNPIGWCIAFGILTAVVLKDFSEKVKKADSLLTED